MRFMVLAARGFVDVAEMTGLVDRATARLLDRIVTLGQFFTSIIFVLSRLIPLLKTKAVMDLFAAGAAWAHAHAEIAKKAAIGIVLGIIAAAAVIAAVTMIKPYEPKYPTMERGGIVPETGLYLLHRHERVIPAYERVRPEVYVDIHDVVFLDEKTVDTFLDRFIVKLRGVY